jgi:hypothetical protein
LEEDTPKEHPMEEDPLEDQIIEEDLQNNHLIEEYHITNLHRSKNNFRFWPL